MSVNVARVYAFAVIALLAMVLPVSAAHGGEQMEYKVPSEAEARWNSMQSKLALEYDVCLEHCGDSSACIDKCTKNYKHKTKTAYQTLMYEHASTKVGKDKADSVLYPSCPMCGMNREKFAHSRVLINYDDGSVYPACSLHCAALDMANNIDKAPVRIMVGDYATQKLLDAEQAVWVIGGSKPGVMSSRAKWAFETEKAARDYMNDFGGQLANLELALKATFEDMYEDTRMIRERRKAKRAKHGAMHGGGHSGHGHQ